MNSEALRREKFFDLGNRPDAGWPFGELGC